MNEWSAKFVLHVAAYRILHGYSPYVCTAIEAVTADAEVHRAAKKLIEPFQPTRAEVGLRDWYGDARNPNAKAERLLMIAFALTMPAEMR